MLREGGGGSCCEEYEDDGARAAKKSGKMACNGGRARLRWQFASGFPTYTHVGMLARSCP